MKKVLLVFGTRPEAVKMCPLVNELKGRSGLQVTVCVTGQHRQMLDQALRIFAVTPDYDLDVMRPEQTLFDITADVLSGVREVLERERPDILLVHGDTTTAFAAALAGFYEKIPVGHVEAGLRTYDMDLPYPEEFNRLAVDAVCALHFAPTQTARDNLLREGRRPENIYVTGNTVVDAIRSTVRENFAHPVLDWAADSHLVLVTAHRRENLGEPMEGMLRAIRRAVEERPDVKAVYPVHMNPAVRRTAEAVLGDCERIRLTGPMDVAEFHNLMSRSYLIVTDSGGIQEEASALGKPVLVMRERSERPEGIEAGALRLVGTGEKAVYDSLRELLDDRSAYEKMCAAPNPYGDGSTSRRIADILEGWLENEV